MGSLSVIPPRLARRWGHYNIAEIDAEQPELAGFFLLTQAPVPTQDLAKRTPPPLTAGLLARDLIAKYAAHLPLYHQERVFGRQGLTIAGSALVQ